VKIFRTFSNFQLSDSCEDNIKNFVFKQKCEKKSYEVLLSVKYDREKHRSSDYFARCINKIINIY
ncbi:MAG TPA: hypothetical protein PKN48_12720, partial [Bacteroidales bacterium]|nr:hypothetical protein [Bacteroidales bacterium]